MVPPTIIRMLVGVTSPPTQLSTAGRNGLAIRLRAQEATQCIPRVTSSTVQMSLKSPPPLEAGEGVHGSNGPPWPESGSGSGLGRPDTSLDQNRLLGSSSDEEAVDVEEEQTDRVGSHATASTSFGGGSSSPQFTLHLMDSPGAPHALMVPPDWEQVRYGKKLKQGGKN